MTESPSLKKYINYRLSPFFSGKELEDITNSKLFELAFTHPSYDERNNFEYLEFRGDAIANLAIAQYIRIRFSAIKSAKWFNKLNLALHSTLYMSTIAKKEGFQHYVRLGKNHKVFSPKEKDELMENILEAFCGAIACYCDEKYGFGSGYAIVFSVITSFFERHIPLDVDYPTFFDMTTRAKELVEANLPTKPKWPFSKARIQKMGNSYTAFFDIYPKGDRNPVPENRVQLKITGTSDEDVSRRIYGLVLSEMEKYGFEEMKTDPYQNDFYNKYGNQETPVIEGSVLLLSDAFKTSMYSFFSKTNMKEEYIRFFLEDVNLIEFRKCFIDQSYSPEYNFDIYVAEGENVFNYLINTYISEITKSKSEHTCTNIKQRLSEGFKIPSDIFNDFGFTPFMLYGEAEKKYFKGENLEELKKYQKLKKECFKALLGCFLYYVDRKTFPGVACRLLYYFIRPYLAAIQIKEEENPCSTLKNYYDKNIRKLGGTLKDMTTVIETKVDDIPFHTVQIRAKDRNGNMNIIAEATEKLVGDAKREASRIALKYFRKT